ncbi:hypothetical protein AB0F52_45850 [Amycolatopsis sp. NPDC024027]|uniref:hypothetical protein n=1 Tax=Amycolatopsis sp. NPDC024027 TaxID=3154327 RepID=UPI00340236CD
MCRDHTPGGGAPATAVPGRRLFTASTAAVGSAGRTGVDRSVLCSQSPAIYTNLACYAPWLRQHQQLVKRR